MAQSPSPPEWFKKPIQPIEASHHFRRDFYVCTKCGNQSCGGVYSSVCTQCDGIRSDPPCDDRGRYDYLCNSCARTSHKQSVCNCNYASIKPPTPSQRTPPPILPARRTPYSTSSSRTPSSSKNCCASKWSCPCCSCYW